MSFQNKVEIYRSLMSDKGFSKNTYAPPLYRWLWKCGVKIKPPHASEFKVNLMVQATFFFSIFAVVLFFVSLFANDIGLNLPTGSQVATLYLENVLVSVLFGLAVSFNILQVKKKNKIPNWAEIND
ncbi:DUF6404 family protein [Shewanella salipaludis]|uniref:Uncharacterized protein n=1 Tax=Shewanella salipaludis TaxID=2723052 RepID=A0A972JMC7_9GAMM|nr:DUF6404 family protein [Shewanella salipaludis]NMH64971.1 hypothetical protein [Shewanella salipaludis]